MAESKPASSTIKLEDLGKKIPFRWRVQSFSKHKPKASCVAYIESRDVMDLLDDVCGPENWQDEYYQVKSTMCCRIGILINGEWIWKSDGGVESRMEAEKGELSDAFKRAAVKWNIGRFLYRQKVMYVNSNQAHGPSSCNKFCTCYPVDSRGQRVWDLTEHINGMQKNSPPYSAPAPANKPVAKPAATGKKPVVFSVPKKILPSADSPMLHVNGAGQYTQVQLQELINYEGWDIRTGKKKNGTGNWWKFIDAKGGEGWIGSQEIFDGLANVKNKCTGKGESSQVEQAPPPPAPPY